MSWRGVSESAESDRRPAATEPQRGAFRKSMFCRPKDRRKRIDPAGAPAHPPAQAKLQNRLQAEKAIALEHLG